MSSVMLANLLLFKTAARFQESEILVNPVHTLNNFTLR